MEATGTIKQLMAVTEKLEEVPEEDLGLDRLKELYQDLDFVDDLTGEPLDKDEMVKARKLEIEFFKRRGVYKKVRREPHMRTISTRWIDTNKGDDAVRDYRARLVGREL